MYADGQPEDRDREISFTLSDMSSEGGFFFLPLFVGCRSSCPFSFFRIIIVFFVVYFSFFRTIVCLTVGVTTNVGMLSLDRSTKSKGGQSSHGSDVSLSRLCRYRCRVYVNLNQIMMRLTCFLSILLLYSALAGHPAEVQTGSVQNPSQQTEAS